MRSRSDRRAKKTERAEPPASEPAEHFFIGDNDDDSQRSRSERRFLPDKRADRVPIPSSNPVSEPDSIYDDSMFDFMSDVSEEPDEISVAVSYTHLTLPTNREV